MLDGVHDCLAWLRPRVDLAIVTTCPGRHFEIQHRDTGLLPRFDRILVREDYGRAKPDPEPYVTAAGRFGLRPEECVVVEDTERGLASALSAGMRCFAIPHGPSAGQRFAGATAVLSSIRELPAALGGLDDWPADRAHDGATPRG